jgi:hypothetical protein
LICPHCNVENADGRKYCRECAKPLTAVPLPNTPTPPPFSNPSLPAANATSPAPVTSSMALASLVLSFFSLFVPLGIVAIVLGHISRGRIAKSSGRQKGTGIAFAALILGYLQLAVAGVLILVFGLAVVGTGHKMYQELDKDPELRAALAERLKKGDPYKVAIANAAKHQENTIAALHLIRAMQRDYFAAHPQLGYACDLNELGATKEGSELGLHMRDSLYEIKVVQCSRVGEFRYVVLAVAVSDFNPPNSPGYCLDQTEVIHKFSDEQAASVTPQVAGSPRELCPDVGERVE